MNKTADRTSTAAGIRDNLGKICVNMETLTALLDCGRPTAEQIAIQSGAKIKIGRRSLYNVEKIKNYIDGFGGCRE